MDKAKLIKIFEMLQELVIEAIKNPTFVNVRFLIDVATFMQTLRDFTIKIID